MPRMMSVGRRSVIVSDFMSCCCAPACAQNGASIEGAEFDLGEGRSLALKRERMGKKKDAVDSASEVGQLSESVASVGVSPANVLCAGRT